jgi:hypothetical protein
LLFRFSLFPLSLEFGAPLFAAFHARTRFPRSPIMTLLLHSLETKRLPLIKNRHGLCFHFPA